MFHNLGMTPNDDKKPTVFLSNINLWVPVLGVQGVLLYILTSLNEIALQSTQQECYPQMECNTRFNALKIFKFKMF